MSEAKPTLDAPSETQPRAVSAWAIATVTLLLCALWLLDLFVQRTSVLTPFVALGEKLPALTPIYAFWLPVLSVRAIGFAIAALVFVASAARLARPEHTPRAVFVAALLLFATILPLCLFAVRQEPSELGSQLAIYPNEDVYFDALQIREYRPFLAHYVELMPRLSLHGRHFPPGHASLLYAVGQRFGTGLLPAGIAVLACFVMACLFVYRAIARISGEARARQGAFLLLAAPSALDFACTSMDAVFLLFASVAWWLAAGVVRSLECTSQPTLAQRFVAPLQMGVGLLVATCFSFSAVPLGFAIGLALAITGRNSWREASEALALVGAGYSAAAVALFASTGFALWDCLAAARSSNLEFMTRVIGRDAYDVYGLLSYGNGAAFLIGSGVALVFAASAGVVFWKRAWNAAFVITLGVMTFGGMYFMETERIWLFAMPWLAAIASSGRTWTSGSLRLLLALGCVQALAMETLLFTLW